MSSTGDNFKKKPARRKASRKAKEPQMQWELKPFGEIVEFSQYGLSIPTSPDGNYFMFKMNHFQNGKMITDNIEKVKLDKNELGKYRLNKGDILFNRTNSYDLVGKTAVFTLNGDYTAASYIVRFVLDKKQCNPNFINYFFNWDRSQKNLKEFATKGVSQSNINPTNLQKYFLVPVPPLTEQEKIVSIIGVWDKAIEKTEQLIAKKQQLKKGLMQQLLTGKVRFKEFKSKKIKNLVIEDLISFSGGSQPPRSTFKFTQENGYIRLIQNRDYKSDKYKTYIPEEFANKKCDRTDIMIGRYGPPLFQLFRGLEGAYNVALIKAIPNEEELLKEYCWYFLNRPELQKYIDGFSQRSGGQTGIEMDRLNSYPFPLPSLIEQKRIVSVLSLIDKEIENLDKQLALLRIQKKGLMQKLLTGELRVKI